MKTPRCTRASLPLHRASPSRAASVAVAPIAAIGVLLLAAGAAAAQPAPAARIAAPGLDARYDAARDEYEVGHFQAAFAEFAVLADAGHCSAARMALQMLRFGKALYATEFRAPVERAQQWAQLQACATSTRP